MESTLYGIFALVGFVSEIERVSASIPFVYAFHEVVSIFFAKEYFSESTVTWVTFGYWYKISCGLGLGSS